MLKYTLVVGATLFTIMGLATVPAQAIDPPQIRPIARPVIYPRGLEVTRVVPGSPAALAGLERGDVIIAVDRQGVRTPDELHRLLHATGHRGELTVRDIRTGRLVVRNVFTRGGHIGVSVAPVMY